MLGRTTYWGFYLDLILEGFAASSSFLTLVIAGIIYIGIFLYIKSMVKDMEMRIAVIDIDPVSNLTKIWSIYVREMTFRTEITR